MKFVTPKKPVQLLHQPKPKVKKGKAITQSDFADDHQIQT